MVAVVTKNDLFPVRADPTGKYLVDKRGRPFLVMGVSAWSAEVQLTRAQMDTWLDDRMRRGFTAILVQGFEHKFSSQTPAYRNAADAADPFAVMSPLDFSQPNSTYWSTFDYLVAGAKRRGMLVFCTFAYIGFALGTEGWSSDINASSAANLQAFGAFLEARYGGPDTNFIPVAGGDNSDSATVAQQANVVTGMRSVRKGQVIAAHPARGEDSYAIWGPGGRNDPWWNLNTTYCGKDGSDVYTLAATALGRTGYPFGLIEGGYEGEGGNWRKCAYGTYLSGGCFHFFGNNPEWGFAEPIDSGGAGAAAFLATGMDTAGVHEMGYCVTLLRSVTWWLGVPKTDASLVSSSLSTGTSRLYPMLASDGTWALIYVPSAQTVTVVMTAFTKALMRIRLMDVLTGTFTLVGFFANTGTQSVVTTAEQVIVAD